MEEKLFPIYRFEATWDQEDYKNNGTSWHVMFKEQPTEEKLNSILEDYKKVCFEKYKNVTDFHSKYEFVENESWCLNWFNHYTLNLFDTDEEVERSFRQFIRRKKDFNLKNGHRETKNIEGNKNPWYCFMGAEDTWRWNICRCEHCQKAGKITIDH